MRFVHTAISIFFVAYIFMGNAGLRVFKHACEKDGIFTSYIIQLDDHCGNHEEENIPECCQKVKIEKDDCCSDEVKIYQVDFDFFQDYNQEIPLFFIQPDPIQFAVLEENCDSNPIDLFVPRPPPDKLSGRQILILNQVFRI